MNADIGLFILRVATGLALLTHGWPKLKDFMGTMKWLQSEGFPLVFISKCLVVLSEFFGAILLVLGVYVQYVAAYISLEFVIVIFYHSRKRQGWAKMELAVLYLAATITLALAGAGAWALI